MNNRNIFTAVAALIVLAIGIFIYSQGQNESEVADQTNNSNTEAVIENVEMNNDEMPQNTNTDAMTPPTEAANPSTGEPTAPQNVDVAVFEVVYNGTNYSPAQLTIKNGDVVIFKNESDKSFWPASAPHPQHTDYPEFDPKKALGAGQEWQFKFTKTGAWGFHDHINPSAFGRITVQ